MKIYTEVLGNVNHSEEWAKKLENLETDYIFLDQWTAQKSRFLGKGMSGAEYPVALKRHTQVADGDIIEYDPDNNRAVVLRIELSPVMVIDMSGIKDRTAEDIIRISVELGHAIGNQHWPAVVKGTTVYVPLTVDRKVMMSVMETHNIEGITYEFRKGLDVIPYLAPHEVRRLFGGAGHESHSHEHGHIVYAPGFKEEHGHEHHHDDDHDHCHDHDHDHPHHHHDHCHDDD